MAFYYDYIMENYYDDIIANYYEFIRDIFLKYILFFKNDNVMVLSWSSAFNLIGFYQSKLL